MRIDFTNVQDSGTLPADDYTVKVTDGELRTGKTSGKPYINWTLTVQEGKYEGRLIWTNTSLSEEALGFGLKPLLSATGKFDMDGEIDFEIEDVVGSDIVVTLKPAKNDPSETEVKKYKRVSDSASLLP